jgi:UDP-N-acetylglucosamine 2-epimerase
LAGALVGAKLNIPVAHVEAGLRSFNRSMPEEINRVATDHVSDLLFAPTQAAMHHLRREGLEDRAHFSGDVMYDMILMGLEYAHERSRILELLDLEDSRYYLATLHRPYNVDDPGQLNEIMTGLARLEEKVVLSAHPRLWKNLRRFGIDRGENIHISEPLGYLDFIILEKHARKVITDSGGVQKEAFFLQTPCVTLRPETEWVETVDAGANVLVRERTSAAIVEAVRRDISPNFRGTPFGDGNACDIIIDIIQSRYYN